ncbi:MAG: hypothetical protein K2F90_03615 [Clostridiales bacterium]|nr:hypothetical protein [Clostridiales bacterium]
MKKKKSRKNKSRVNFNLFGLLICLVYIPIMFCMFFGSKKIWVEFAISLSVAVVSFVLLIIYALKKKLKLRLYIAILLVVLIGIAIAFCVISGIERDWIGFSVCLLAVVVMIIIVIPLTYSGDTYECPNCGHVFKANPYKVFFTNGILRIFGLGDGTGKSAELKCPNCKTKDWCKRRSK